MSKLPLTANFSQGSLDPQLHWHCEPGQWSIDPIESCLRVWPAAGTDFWQRTHYGFEADNGHFLYWTIEEDFVLTACVTSHPVHQYDQAGLMVRVSPTCWVKASVEYEPHEENRLGAVVTNAQYSDWSTRSLSPELATVWFRVRGCGNDVIVESAPDGQTWQQIRLAPLLERQTTKAVMCGIYACSPKGAGFQAEFRHLSCYPPS